VFGGEWFHTKDAARQDDDGYIWYEGRADDVIIAAGYRIGPFEVESACLEHPAVREAAAIASPDELRGNVVKAFIVLALDCEPSDELAEEIKTFVRDRLSAYAYPRRIDAHRQDPPHRASAARARPSAGGTRLARPSTSRDRASHDCQIALDEVSRGGGQSAMLLSAGSDQVSRFWRDRSSRESRGTLLDSARAFWRGGRIWSPFSLVALTITGVLPVSPHPP